MDPIEKKREIIQKILLDNVRIPYAYGDIKILPVFDTERDHYLIVLEGWHQRRVHGCLVHVDIIEGKYWIQRDGTEYSIARELEDAGVPKDQIVLAFHEPKVRKYTDYAVA